MARRISDNGLQLIAGFEGLSLRLYNDPAGHCTIGYGHLVHHGSCNGREPQEFKRGITESRARALLRSDAANAESAVNGAVAVPLGQNQFDALVSFVYNVGAGAFRSSTLLRELNRRHYDAVPEQLRRWVHAGGQVLPGLVRRREAEARLWLTPDADGDALVLAGGEDEMAVIVKTRNSRTNYVTNFVVRRPIRSVRERSEMIAAGLPSKVHLISAETMRSIPVIRVDG